MERLEPTKGNARKHYCIVLVEARDVAAGTEGSRVVYRAPLKCGLEEVLKCDPGYNGTLNRTLEAKEMVYLTQELLSNDWAKYEVRARWAPSMRQLLPAGRWAPFRF